jgi:amidase
MSDELAYLSATEAVARFAAHELSPVELVDALIARCEAVNPRVNALTYTFFERAREQARAAEDVYLQPSGSPRPLEGVPLAIKDEHPIAGEVSTHGSKIYAGKVDEETIPTTQRLLDAGAILFARTTCPEFSTVGVTHSPLWGVTRNPWNLAYTPGGSSGGAGAAVAAGMTTLADGSDYGGSIRIPATTCGVFGYKPPWGRNPGNTPWNLDPYNHYGPITRTVGDGALMQNVMSGIHPRDIASLRERVTIPSELEAIDGWRIAFSMDLGYCEIDPEVARNTYEALDVFRELGCQVDEVDLGWTRDVLDAYSIRGLWGLAAGAGPLLEQHRDVMSPHLVAQTEQALGITAADLAGVPEVQAAMYDTLGPILGRHDLFICPTAGLPAVPADQQPHIDEVRINGSPVDPWLGWVLTYPFNMLSQLPVANVPSGVASSGVPTGIQLVGRSFDDLSVFRAAAAYERARPWLDTPERRPAFREA